MLVRLAFVVATAAGGAGMALYALAWLVVPAGDAAAARSAPGSPGGRAAVEVALGSGLLLLSVLLTFRALGIWFSDAIVWPLVLIATGGVLIWRQSLGSPRRRHRRAPREAAGQSAAGRAHAPRAAAVSRTGIGRRRS